MFVCVCSMDKSLNKAQSRKGGRGGGGAKEQRKAFKILSVERRGETGKKNPPGV